MPKYGLAVCVPDDGRAIAGIRKSGRLSLYGQPLKLAKSGAVVALVQVDGTVVLTARASTLVGPLGVRLLSGQWRDRGYPGRLCCDLFDLRRWRLLKAKVQSDRITLRTAVGQLLDYKRFHLRAPSLGVLVGSKPSSLCIRYLADCGITAVWQTRAGWFRDSTEERAWSSARRRPQNLCSGTGPEQRA
jgi:hypothetical protein